MPPIFTRNYMMGKKIKYPSSTTKKKEQEITPLPCYTISGCTLKTATVSFVKLLANQ